MESKPRCGNDHNAPPPPFNNSLKLETPDQDFCIDNFSSSSSSRTYLQDFHHLDQFPLASPFNLDIDAQFNTFDPFFHGCPSNIELYQCNNKPHEGIGITGAPMQGGGFLSFPNEEDQLMDVEPDLIYDDLYKPLNILVSDESSCITADFRKENSMKKGRCGNEARFTLSKMLAVGQKRTKSGKGQWTAEEDRLLIHLVEKYGEKKWSRIAQTVKGRIGKQCRERWHNHLRPDIKKDLWTEDEDRILIETHAEVGNKWARIAKKLPGRTENSIKNHWNATKRRQFSRRKCRTKWPTPSSILQNYIKSLNFEKGCSSTRSRKTAQSQNFRHESSNVSEMDFTLADLDDVPDFTFMDDLPLPDDDDEPCFDVDLPFDLPATMN